MDWSNEPYVRVYTRETDDDLALSWEARALWDRLMTKFDRSGIVATKRGARGLAALVRIPAEIVERTLPELLADGRLREIDGGYLSPNFMDAQSANKSDKLRQKESRERRRSGVTLRDVLVTARDEIVTLGHTASLLADPDPIRSVASARDSSRLAVSPDQDPALRTRREIGDRAWEELNAIRQRIAKGFGWRDVRPLHPMDPGRVELAERLRESGAEAETNLKHVLAIAEAEAVSKRTVEWLNGAMFRAESWRKKLAMRLDDARRGPRSSAETQQVRIERDDDAPPPLRPVAGGKP